MDLSAIIRTLIKAIYVVMIVLIRSADINVLLQKIAVRLQRKLKKNNS
jgi:hypothetical protein